MYKKLSIVCMLLVMLFSLISCSIKTVPLSFDEWIDCTIYCGEIYCTANISIGGSDPDSPVINKKILNKECLWKCSNECTFSGSDIVNEWKLWRNPVVQCKDVTGDSQ